MNKISVTFRVFLEVPDEKLEDESQLIDIAHKALIGKYHKTYYKGIDTYIEEEEED